MKINEKYMPGADRAKQAKSVLNHDHFFCEGCGSYYDEYSRQDTEDDDDED